MSSLLLFSLLLFLSIEACSGRSLVLGIKDLTVSSHDLSKDADKASFMLKPLKKGSKIGELLGGANVQGSEVVGMKRESMPSGTAVPSSHVGSPKTVKSEVGSDKQPHALLGFRSGEETVETDGSTMPVAGDFVSVDYQRPRAGPPIHNR